MYGGGLLALEAHWPPTKFYKYDMALYTCPRLLSREMSEILVNEHVVSQYSFRAFQ